MADSGMPRWAQSLGELDLKLLEQGLLTIRAAVAKSPYSERTIRRLIAAGKLRSKRMGKWVVVPDADLDGLMAFE